MRLKPSVGNRLAQVSPRFVVLGIALVAIACEEALERPLPPIITSPETPTKIAPPRATLEMDPEVGPPAPPPPWPPMEIVQGRFSPEFAREYVELVRREREAFDAEMAKPLPPPTSPAEATHRRISERGRRQRLMNKPTLATITDEEISDVISFNPDMPSGERELERLLAAHPRSLSICVDHGRWLLYRKRRDDALSEYQRCARLPGISEDQLRYVQTAILAAKNAKL